MLALPAELTQTQATACLAQLRPLLQAQAEPVVTLDARALQQFDSAALAVLLELRRCAQGLGKTLRLDGVPERLQRLAALYGIESLLSS